jgi:hypothetical protein
MIRQDRAALAAVRAKIKQFNAANPEYPIKEASIRQSVRSRQTMRERARGGVLINPRLGHLYEEAGGYEEAAGEAKTAGE